MLGRSSLRPSRGLLSTLSSVDYRQWLTAKEALKLASEGGAMAGIQRGAMVMSKSQH